MALKVIEGFDYYPNAAAVLLRRGFLQWTQLGYAAPTMETGRYNSAGQSLNFGTTAGMLGSMSSNFSEIYVGCGLLLIGVSSLYLMETASGTQQIRITFNADGSITHPFGRTVNNTIPHGTWFFFEFGGTISKTTGTFVMKVNGQVVYSGSGLNTSPGVNAYVNAFAIDVVSLNQQLQIDDLYICDGTSGPGANACNTFLGDRRVFLLSPTGPGSSTGWTPSSSGTPNWQEVLTADGDASYNSTSTVGAEDLFYLSALPSNVTQVIGIQVTGSYRKTDATDHTLSQHIQSGTTDVALTAFLSPYALSTDYQYYSSDPLTVDPNTGAAWTLAALNAGTIQAGYHLDT